MSSSYATFILSVQVLHVLYELYFPTCSFGISMNWLFLALEVFGSLICKLMNPTTCDLCAAAACAKQMERGSRK